MHSTTLLLTALLGGIAYADDDTVLLQRADPGHDDGFGSFVALDWPYAVIGSRWDDAVPTDSGSAYVFDASTGQELFKLVPEHDVEDGWFGDSVDLEGTVALIGSPLARIGNNPQGAAFTFDVTTGTKILRLKAPDGNINDNFGSAVAMDQGIALIGAPGDDDTGANSGSAYIMDIATGQQLHKLYPPVHSPGLRFGSAVDIHDGVCVIASNSDAGVPDQAFLFDVATGTLIAELVKQQSSAVNGWYGNAVAIHGDFVAVGAPLPIFNAKGEVNIFDSATGQPVALLTPPIDEPSGFFGRSISLNDTTLVVGDTNGGVSTTGRGRVDVFDVGTWTPRVSLYSTSPSALDYGRGVDLDGDHLLIGDDREGTSQNRIGAAYVRTIPGPIGTSYCGPAVPNSSGNSATLTAAGSDQAQEDCVWLSAQGMATGQFSMVINSQAQGFVIPPGAQGNLCLSGAIGRHKDELRQTGDLGSALFPIDLTGVPTPTGDVAVQAGETWNFQVWFRDANPGTTSNFTDGLSITFQ